MDNLDIRKLFGKEVYSKDLAQALTEGWLADVDYRIIFDNAVKEAMESGFEGYTIKQLKELLQNQSRNEQIAEQIKDELRGLGLENAQTILFCQTIEHAEEMAQALGGSAYHSEMPKAEKVDVLHRFRNNGLNIITTRDMFNEGVDIPDARAVVFLRSTSSRTIFEQQLGRGLRKSPGKDSVTVLDFVANIERLSYITSLVNEVRDIDNENTGSDSDGENVGSGTDNIEGGESGNLHIHTEHSDFDFDKISVLLLSKLNELRDKVVDWSGRGEEEIVQLALEMSPGKQLTDPEISELSKNGIFPSSSTIRNIFGSIINFQRACGFEVTDWKGAKPEYIIELAQELSPDKKLTSRLINELSRNGKFPSVPTIQRMFNSVKDFQEACGHKASTPGELSADSIVALALEISPEKKLTDPEIRELSKKGSFPSSTTIKRAFGSIDKFQEACGFGKEAKKEAAINSALEISPEKKLTAKQINEMSKEGLIPSSQAIKTLFGSVKAFQQACGFED